MNEFVAVPSLSKDDTWYSVRKSAAGILSCDCPAPKKAGSLCKHAQLVYRADVLIKRCNEKHSTTGVVCRACFVAVMATAARKAAKLAKDFRRAGIEHEKEKAARRREKKGAKNVKA